MVGLKLVGVVEEGPLEVEVVVVEEEPLEVEVAVEEAWRTVEVVVVEEEAMRQRTDCSVVMKARMIWQ